MLGAAVAALGLFACGAALTIGSGSGAWGERTVPLLAGVTITLSGLAISTERPTERAAARGGEGLALALLLLGGLWVIGLGLFGFLIPTALAAPAALALFGERRAGMLAAAALMVPVALHLFFFRVLGVFPPFGRWFDLADYVPI